MYLPALPAIAVEFGVEVTRLQLAVGLFLLGLGLGQFLGAPMPSSWRTLAGIRSSTDYCSTVPAFSGVLALNVSAVALFTVLNFRLLRKHAAHRAPRRSRRTALSTDC